MLAAKKKKTYIAAFLNNVTTRAIMALCYNQKRAFPSDSFSFKNYDQSAAIAFFFSSFLSPRSVYFSSPCSFLGGFSGLFCLWLLVFFLSQKTAIFVRYVFKNPARECFGFYGYLYINFRTDILKYTSFTILKLVVLLLKVSWRGAEDSFTNSLRCTTMQSF